MLTFLGEHPGETHRLFQLNLKTGVLATLAAASTNIMSYSLDEGGTHLAYEALAPLASLWNAKTARHGLVVTDQTLLEVTLGGQDPFYDFERRLFVKDTMGTRAIKASQGSGFPGWNAISEDRNVSISPDGRYIVVAEDVPVDSIPPRWHQYRDPWIRYVLSVMGKARGEGGRSFLARYVLIDTGTDRQQVLLDSPIFGMMNAPVIWAPNSRSVILSQVLLPIDTDHANMQGKVPGPSTVEVAVGSRRISGLGKECRVAWSWKGSEVTCNSQESAKDTGADQSCPAPAIVRFRKSGGQWRPVSGPTAPSIEVFLKEGMNSPPNIYFSVRGQEGSRLLWDMNPQFHEQRLASERLVTWEWSKGRKITGGLYYPTDYQPGRRYPLVIQTHEFDRNRFDFFGPFSTANAAQPLAARGIFVLQLDDIDTAVLGSKHGQLEEVERAIRLYKSGITYLSAQGLIDSKRVGIIGFSHTCFFVDWALTHEPRLFAAAAVEEGGDGSYTEYMLGTVGAVLVRSLYPGPPFGRYLKSWMETSPEFNLDRVRAPLLITVTHNQLASDNWEWLNGLRDLGKPVEMIVLDGRANDDHLLTVPWDRQISSGGSTDWFDFWLNGNIDPNPQKAAQYLRWRHLRTLEQHESDGQADWASVKW